MTAAAVAAAKKGDIRVEELKDGRIKGQGTGGAGEAGRERPGQHRWPRFVEKSTAADKILSAAA